MGLACVIVVIGQVLEAIDQDHAICGSTTGSNYYVRVLSILDRELLDEIVQMDGEEAIRTARLLMGLGIMAGISTGSNVRAALDLAARPEMQGKNIVTFACDTSERYMSTRLFQQT